MKKIIATLPLFLLLSLAILAQKNQQQHLPKPPNGYANETLLKMAYVVGFLDLIETKPEVPNSILAFKNIVYKKLETENLQLDIYRKKELTEAAPTLIFIHGGGWKKGKRADYLPYLINYAEKGYITITISYRLSDVAKFPAQILDVKSAVEWIRQNASKYMINPEKIAVIGGSAGGHLAMLLGYSNETDFTQECSGSSIPKVQAIVNLYGPADLTTEYAKTRGEIRGLIGKTYNEAPNVYISASPNTYISPDDTPTLIFHGTIDSLVPVSQSDNLHKKLNEAGVENDYHRLKGWPHTMDLAEKVNDYCTFYMDTFFEKYLRNEK